MKRPLLNRLKVAWRILTRNDWFVINTEPPERPFDLWLGSIQVHYYKEREK